MKPLPSGWATATLGLLAGNGQYGWTTKACAVGSVRFLRTTDITKPAIDWIAVPYCAELPTDPEKYALTAGDIVISRAGSVGFSKLLEAPPEPTLFASYLIRFKPTAAVHPPFLANYLRSNEYWQYIGGASAGIALANVNASSLAKLNVPVPPMAEQKRIADKLDTVLTRVDAVSARLARVAPLLKRFRQSVLAAATSGRLTSEWRESNAMHQPWRDMTLGSLIEDMRNGLATKPDESPAGKKILRISAVRPGVLDTTDHRYLTADEVDARIYNLRKGDLLFTRYNGSLEFVGVCALVSEDLPEYVYPDKLIRVRANTAVVLPKFIEIASAEAEARAQIEGFVKSSAGQKGISGSNLKSLRLSVPPLEEQAEIVRRVDVLFAFADRLEARLNAAQTATGRLTPALLAKAFRGELVPQDPNDEPASELLRRLQAASGHRAPARAAGRGRKRSI